MKKELSPVATGGLIVIAVAVLGTAGFFWLRNATGSAPEDPALAQKQLEVERSMRPGNGGATANQPPPGFSPGSNAEWEARQKGKQ